MSDGGDEYVVVPCTGAVWWGECDLEDRGSGVAEDRLTRVLALYVPREPPSPFADQHAAVRALLADGRIVGTVDIGHLGFYVAPHAGVTAAVESRGIDRFFIDCERLRYTLRK